MSKELDIQIGISTKPQNIGINLGGKPNDISILLERNGSPISKDVVISGTKTEWNERIDFVPKAGQIVLYTDYYGDDMPAIKIGDGLAYLIDLPVVGGGIVQQVMDSLRSHIADSTVHVTDAEKTFWNNKLNLEISGEDLILNRS